MIFTGPATGPRRQPDKSTLHLPLLSFMIHFNLTKQKINSWYSAILRCCWRLESAAMWRSANAFWTPWPPEMKALRPFETSAFIAPHHRELVLAAVWRGVSPATPWPPEMKALRPFETSAFIAPHHRELVLAAVWRGVSPASCISVFVSETKETARPMSYTKSQISSLGGKVV